MMYSSLLGLPIYGNMGKITTFLTLFFAISLNTFLYMDPSSPLY